MGKTYLHPLVVLKTLNREHEQVRIGIIAGRGIGKAVVRNRIKRLLRACMQDLHPEITPGNDLLLLARQSITQAKYSQVQVALKDLLEQAQILKLPDAT